MEQRNKKFNYCLLASIAGVLVVLVILLSQVSVFESNNLPAAVVKAVLAELTNNDRIENKAPALADSPLLDQAATLKAEDMAEKGYFAHQSPDGKLPWYWLDKVGYDYTYAGENLAINFFDSADVADAWMKSPTHRENIVNKNYTEMGFGLAEGMYQGKNTVFVVQFFGAPASSQQTVKINPIKEIIPTKTETKKETTPTTVPSSTPTTGVAIAPAPNTGAVLGAENTRPLGFWEKIFHFFQGGTKVPSDSLNASVIKAF